MVELYTSFVYVESQDVLYEICGYVGEKTLNLDTLGVLEIIQVPH